jgi:putative transposase
MNKISRFVIWICSKFTKAEIELIIKELSDILTNRNPEVKPKDDFKQKHPNYRNFSVDPNPPRTEPPQNKKPKANWKQLLQKHEQENGKPLKPIKLRNPKNKVPSDTRCSQCDAPAEYLYFNDGKKNNK